MMFPLKSKDATKLFPKVKHQDHYLPLLLMETIELPVQTPRFWWRLSRFC